MQEVIKFKRMAFLIVTLKKQSTLQGFLVITFSNTKQRDDFHYDTQNLFINNKYYTSSFKSEKNSCEAYFKLPVDNGEIESNQKQQLLTALKAKYLSSYHFDKIPTQKRPFPFILQKSLDYILHVYRGPSRHRFLLSFTLATLSFLTFTGLLGALAIGSFTYGTLSVRAKIYKKKSQQLLKDSFNDVGINGWDAGKAWAPYLVSFLRFQDIKNWQAFGGAMNASMDIREKYYKKPTP